MMLGKHEIVTTGKRYKFIVRLQQQKPELSPTEALAASLTEAGEAITAFYEYYKKHLKPEAGMVMLGKKYPQLRMLEARHDRIIYAVEG